MSEASLNMSPEALLAGIEAIARAIGRNCQMEVYVAMARAEASSMPPAIDESVLRDQFATAALPAIISAAFAGSIGAKGDAPVTEEIMASQAYEFADAMLAARGAA